MHTFSKTVSPAACFSGLSSQTPRPRAAWGGGHGCTGGSSNNSRTDTCRRPPVTARRALARCARAGLGFGNSPQAPAPHPCRPLPDHVGPISDPRLQPRPRRRVCAVAVHQRAVIATSLEAGSVSTRYTPGTACASDVCAWAPHRTLAAAPARSLTGQTGLGRQETGPCSLC